MTSRGKQVTLPLQSPIFRAFGWFLAVTGLSYLAWFRLPEVSRGTLWAEDAAVFLQETIELGTWASVIEPYAGYLHTIPRLVSAVAYSIAPIEEYALLMSFLSCAVVASISVGSYVLSGQVFQHRSYRLMVALIPVMVPIGPLEVLGNVANLHWYLLWLCPWLLVYETRNRGSRLGLFVATLLCATTEIIVGIFVPLAVWAVVRRRNYWASAGLITGLSLQLVATISNPRYSEAPRLDAVDPLSVVYGFFLQAVGSIWETNPATMALNVVNFGGYAVAIPAIIIFGLLAYIVVYGQSRWKAAAIVSFSAAATCWAASTLLNPSPEFDFAKFQKEDWLSEFTFFRYAAAPSMFLLVLVPLACAVAQDRKVIAPNRTRYWAPLLMAVFISTSYFQASSLRQTGPEWKTGVQAAAAQCNADSSSAEAVIYVTPAGWAVAVPCPLLVGR